MDHHATPNRDTENKTQKSTQQQRPYIETVLHLAPKTQRTHHTQHSARKVLPYVCTEYGIHVHISVFTLSYFSRVLLCGHTQHCVSTPAFSHLRIVSPQTSRPLCLPPPGIQQTNMQSHIYTPRRACVSTFSFAAADAAGRVLRSDVRHRTSHIGQFVKC